VHIHKAPRLLVKKTTQKHSSRLYVVAYQKEHFISQDCSSDNGKVTTTLSMLERGGRMKEKPGVSQP
jgi:hypothetical protein